MSLEELKLLPLSRIDRTPERVAAETGQGRWFKPSRRQRVRKTWRIRSAIGPSPLILCPKRESLRRPVHRPDSLQHLLLSAREVLFQPVLEQPGNRQAGGRSYSRRTAHQLRAAALRIAGISCSVSPGMMGATITPTGMPAVARAEIASSRPAGRVVRGSRRPIRSSSSDRDRDEHPRRLMCASLRADRFARDQPVLGDDRDRLAKLREHFQAAASAQLAFDRLIGIGHPAHAQHARPPFGVTELSRSSAGASYLTMILVSKSSPAENPRYSCVGRA